MVRSSTVQGTDEAMRLRFPAEEVQHRLCPGVRKRVVEPDAAFGRSGGNHRHADGCDVGKSEHRVHLMQEVLQRAGIAGDSRDVAAAAEVIDLDGQGSVAMSLAWRVWACNSSKPAI